MLGFAIVFCYGILIICRSRIGVRRTLKLIVVLAGSLMPILFFSVSSKNPMVLTIYLFPLIVAQVFLVPLITAVDFRKVRFQKFLLPLMFLGSVFINFSQNLASESNGKYAINTYLSDSNSTDRVKQVEAQQALSKLIVDRRPITIVQSYRSPTLVSNLRRNVLVLYSFDNWGQYLDIANIDYVLINQNDLARLNSQDQELQIAEQKNRTQELRIGIDLIDRLFIDNYFGDQKCRQIASEYGNTLFSCS